MNSEPLVQKFKSRFGHEPKVYDVVISDGARRVEA